MKTIIRQFVSAVLLITVMSAGLYASEARKADVVTIKTSAICGSCKARIEKVVKAVEGVDAVLLNMNNKKLKVKYDPDKTSPERLREVISAAGYDADNVKKNPDAFSKLPQCCQTPMEGDMH
ncbi:MAG TPA: heavy metal-associated domain-containing protein [Chitinophagales bacterium]|nr:heavy metal-associated domain-containing protein [Chitinophagales bacterium]